jgi:hypothetical protein
MVDEMDRPDRSDIIAPIDRSDIIALTDPGSVAWSDECDVYTVMIDVYASNPDLH